MFLLFKDRDQGNKFNVDMSVFMNVCDFFHEHERGKQL
jgi:hypothetical protein